MGGGGNCPKVGRHYKAYTFEQLWKALPHNVIRIYFEDGYIRIENRHGERVYEGICYNNNADCVGEAVLWWTLTKN